MKENLPKSLLPSRSLHPIGFDHLSVRLFHRKLSGIWRSWFRNGQLEYRGSYLNGKANGIQEEWFEDGGKSLKTFYRKGLVNGKIEVWFENGNCKSISYFEDKLQ